jgi:broad specificity phosphatase PhoE
VILPSGVTLYLIRHGETDWNRAQRYQGQRDIPLNDTGKAQAKRNGSVLKGLLPSIAGADFVSSPLSRAIDTMQLLRTEMGLDAAGYRLEPQLLELHYGHWEGHLATALPGVDPEGAAAKARDPFGWRPIGGESYADLMDRIKPWLARIERDTVAVTHGGVSRVARGALLDIETKDVPTLEVPQDQVLVLRDRTMAWI